MKQKFFQIPVLDASCGETALNRFCDQHVVQHLEKHFVQDGQNSFWAVCVTWSANTGALNAKPQRKEKVDYKEVLSAEDFVLYSRLREQRKTIAESEGIPAYAVFTNEQLAEMVKRRVSALSALAEITGIGQARIEKYGDVFLNNLRTLLAGGSGEAPNDQS